MVVVLAMWGHHEQVSLLEANECGGGRIVVEEEEESMLTL